MMKPNLDSEFYKKMCKLAKSSSMPLLVNELKSINLKQLIRNNQETNKGDFGMIAIIGGNQGMHGALYLAGRAAMLCGAGKVVLAPLDKNFKPDILMPELIIDKYDKVLKQLEIYSVIIIGPGLGQDDKAHKLIDFILQHQPINPCIFDADALNLIAKNFSWQVKFKKLPNKIITPHPMEASRLLRSLVSEIQDNRISAIKSLYEDYNAITLLKGYGSLIYDGNILFINPTGNPGLSNAGQGDTLCGIVSAFIAQKLNLLEALRLGVYLHGLAGDYLAKELYNNHIGLLSSEVALKVRNLLNNFKMNIKGK